MTTKEIKVLPIYAEEMKKGIDELGNTKETLKAFIIGYAKHYKEKYNNWSMDDCINEATNFVFNTYEMLELELPTK